VEIADSDMSDAVAWLNRQAAVMDPVYNFPWSGASVDTPREMFEVIEDHPDGSCAICRSPGIVTSEMMRCRPEDFSC
jgi:hypothetical protein